VVGAELGAVVGVPLAHSPRRTTRGACIPKMRAVRLIRCLVDRWPQTSQILRLDGPESIAGLISPRPSSCPSER
jgi:hypothetical protein